MSGIDEQVSVGAMPPTTSTTDRYSEDEDDYGDESFSAEPEQPSQPQQTTFAPDAGSAAAAPAANATPTGTMSERVQDFIKKSSISSGALDDQRLKAKPLFVCLRLRLSSMPLECWATCPAATSHRGSVGFPQMLYFRAQ